MVTYGDEVPLDKIDKDLVATLIKKGKMGDMVMTSDIASEKAALLNQVSSLKADNTSMEEQIEKLESEIALKDAEIAKLQADLEAKGSKK
jgi:cell division protein FtsB